VSRPVVQHSRTAANATLPELAASLCIGLVRNHPFVDGNERTGFLAAYTFMALNGLELTATEDEVASTIEAVASGSVDEAGLAAWLAARSHARR
jgi:death-on-curing protein